MHLKWVQAASWSVNTRNHTSISKCVKEPEPVHNNHASWNRTEMIGFINRWFGYLARVGYQASPSTLQKPLSAKNRTKKRIDGKEVLLPEDVCRRCEKGKCGVHHPAWLPVAAHFSFLQFLQIKFSWKQCPCFVLSVLFFILLTVLRQFCKILWQMLSLLSLSYPVQLWKLLYNETSVTCYISNHFDSIGSYLYWNVKHNIVWATKHFISEQKKKLLCKIINC